jgi:hypothetical protein
MKTKLREMLKDYKLPGPESLQLGVAAQSRG